MHFENWFSVQNLRGIHKCFSNKEDYWGKKQNNDNIIKFKRIYNIK
jgi:hypothetical protein